MRPKTWKLVLDLQSLIKIPQFPYAVRAILDGQSVPGRIMVAGGRRVPQTRVNNGDDSAVSEIANQTPDLISDKITVHWTKLIVH